ncbi:YjiH family protein [Corynebacterium otitidis]|uniref:YjiH family protein n=1 Tax=Corynebacterium otitidis TaxID=29321 RepID=UPI000627A580|nr:YjiH family protein [Corynebacterium otitidis]KKO83754.1 histidine transporter [Corynebacterium otitidis]
MNGEVSIPVDHAVTLVRDNLGAVVPWLIVALMAYGVARSITRRQWRQSATSALFCVFNAAGLVIGIMAVTDTLPGVLAREDLVPFLVDKLVIPVGLIVPIGSALLAFVVSFGLMEFVGVLMQPVMRPVWKTPGRSAIDAVASFVGSYSLGLLITDRVYQQGRYTGREAAIIATGFSTVSAAFMVVMASSLGIMDQWTLYFVTALVVTFLVTAIVVRIPPLSTIPEEIYPGAEPAPEHPVTGNRVAVAWRRAKEALAEAPSLPRAVGANLMDGIKMAASITPSILSVGLIGLLLATFTPLFEWIGYLFVPFAWLVRLPDPTGTGEAAALSIAELLLPATQMSESASPVSVFVIGVVSVSAIIFFSALVPCILATEIPVKVWHMVVIWFERVALTILIATPLAHGFNALGWLG